MNWLMQLDGIEREDIQRWVTLQQSVSDWLREAAHPVDVGNVHQSAKIRAPENSHSLAHSSLRHPPAEDLRRTNCCRQHPKSFTMSTSELAVSYAALILADEGLEITVRPHPNHATFLKCAGAASSRKKGTN